MANVGWTGKLVASHRELVREGALTKLRSGRTFEKNVHRSRRRAYVFSDLLVLFSQQHATVRVYPLQSLILVAPALVYCAESGPKHQQSHDLFEQAVQLSGVDARLLSADDRDASFFVVGRGAAEGGGQQAPSGVCPAA